MEKNTSNTFLLQLKSLLKLQLFLFLSTNVMIGRRGLVCLRASDRILKPVIKKHTQKLFLAIFLFYKEIRFHMREAKLHFISENIETQWVALDANAESDLSIDQNTVNYTIGRCCRGHLKI